MRKENSRKQHNNYETDKHMNNCNFFVHFSLYDRLYERIPLGMLLFSKGEHTRNIIFHLKNECRVVQENRKLNLCL